MIIMPFVSVIVPVYNVEPYLAQCINSILSQSFEDFEVLLVDDGSKDKSGEICDEYAARDSRIRVFHKENGGLSSARNFGLNRANGKYVMFIDSDDYFLENNAFSRLVRYADERELDILRFDYTAVNDCGDILYVGPMNSKKHLCDRTLSSLEMVKEAVGGEWFAWLYLIKKEILAGMKFDENRRFQEDIDFFARAFASREFQCGYFPTACYAYRKRPDSLTTQFGSSRFYYSFTLCDVFADLASSINVAGLKTLYQYNSVMMYYWTLNSISDDPYYERRKEILNECGIGDIHDRTLHRIKNVRGICKYWLFIVLHPSWSLSLLRLKTRIVVLLKSL